MMKIKFNAKYTTVAVYCILVFAACLLLVTLVFKYSTVATYLHKLMAVLAPVIWGICIAYIINPFMVFCERHFKKWFCRKKPHKALTRTLAVTVSMLVFFGILAGIVGAIVPEIKDTLMDFFRKLPTYLSNLQHYLENAVSDIVKDRPEVGRYLNNIYNNIQSKALDYAGELQPMLEKAFSENGVVTSVTDSVWAFVTGFKNFVLGIFVSVYLLYSKEMFLAQITKIVYALFSERKRNYILKIASRANGTFTSFLTGKSLDSLIIGILAFIGLELMNITDYSVLISLVIGVTNMIPFFGPIIGAIPCAVLILLTSPGKTLIFIIFVFVLQQFDGNILGPKILGNSLGLSPFWIMFAIFVGGGLFGLIGMIAFVPIFAVIYSVVNEYVTSRLSKKELPLETADYVHERTEPTINISLMKPSQVKEWAHKRKNKRSGKDTDGKKE